MDTVIKGGVLVAQYNYRWEIKNFHVAVMVESFLKMQKFRAEIVSNGVKSLWEFWLHLSTTWSGKKEDKVETELQLGYALLKKRGYCSEMDVAIDVAGEDTAGKQIFGFSSRNSGKFANKEHYSTIPKNPELIDGNLIVRITLKVFNPLTPVIKKIKLGAAAADEKRREKFCGMIAKLENDKKNSDVKFISSDGKEFYAHRWILSLESDVFAAMFSSGTKESEVKMNDLSGTTLKLLLHFIYTAKVGPKWSLPGILEELAYAADKYRLEDLKNYLDSNIGKLCTAQRVAVLLSLAIKFSLEEATANIQFFIRRTSKTAEDTIDRLRLNELIPMFNNL